MWKKLLHLSPQRKYSCACLCLRCWCYGVNGIRYTVYGIRYTVYSLRCRFSQFLYPSNKHFVVRLAKDLQDTIGQEQWVIERERERHRHRIFYHSDRRSVLWAIAYTQRLTERKKVPEWNLSFSLQIRKKIIRVSTKHLSGLAKK